jgi:ATPase subunit of ABC transporter with duplicated ATPase domains
VGAGRRAGVEQIEWLVGDQPLRAHRASMPQGEACFLAADDLVEFVEAFARTTRRADVPDRARERLISAIKRAEGEPRDRLMTTQATSGPAIHVQRLEKSYKKLEVLRGVDFDVARGSIVALLGSNRAGKTTILRILSTLLKADAGTANVNDFDVATQPADVREGHQNLQHGVITLLHNAQLHEHQPRPSRDEDLATNQTRNGTVTRQVKPARYASVGVKQCSVTDAECRCRCRVPCLVPADA